MSISLESDGDANAIATGIRVDESSVTATGLVAQAKRVLTGKKGDNKYGSLLDYIENCVVAGKFVSPFNPRHVTYEDKFEYF